VGRALEKLKQKFTEEKGWNIDKILNDMWLPTPVTEYIKYLEDTELNFTELPGKVVYNCDETEMVIKTINDLLDEAKIPVNVNLAKNSHSNRLKYVYLIETKIEGE